MDDEKTKYCEQMSSLKRAYERGMVTFADSALAEIHKLFKANKKLLPFEHFSRIEQAIDDACFKMWDTKHLSMEEFNELEKTLDEGWVIILGKKK